MPLAWRGAVGLHSGEQCGSRLNWICLRAGVDGNLTEWVPDWDLLAYWSLDLAGERSLSAFFICGTVGIRLVPNQCLGPVGRAEGL